MSLSVVDKDTSAQVEAVLVAASAALDQIGTMLGDRDLAFHVVPSTTFLAFCAASQLLKQTPGEQLRCINAGLDVTAKVLARRGDMGTRYGKGRRCADVTRDMALKALECARKDVDGTNLVVNRTAARDTLLYKALLEFCAVSKLLAPSGQSELFAMSNELVAEVIRSGELDRNVVKVGG